MPDIRTFLLLDLGALLTACLCSVACALVGNFLVLRRQSLMGDAIAHAVLPGLAAAFLVAGTRSSLPMFVGALGAGVACALAAEGLRRVARVEAGAAMGVAFSAFFALGVVLMSSDAMRRVDLDADCVLNGMLETVTWASGAVPGRPGAATLLSPGFWAGAPRQLATALAACAVIAGVIAALYKELRLVSFDPGLAAALGFRPGWIATLLVVLTSAASVASFEAVGSILVIAMLICPPAAARMLTDRLGTQVWLSAVLAAGSAAAGYALASFGPGWVGSAGVGVSAAGMIGVTAGVTVAGAVVLAPGRGVVARRLGLRRLALAVVREDLLSLMYRLEEERGSGAAPATLLDATALLVRAGHRRGDVARAARAAAVRGEVMAAGGGAIALTPSGREAARTLVRTHRLWEVYLVEQLGQRPDHVHRTAMALEHHTDAAARAGLEEAARGRGGVDPHGRPIP